MDARIRQRALEAAAKVALTVTSLAGCGGKVLAPDDSDTAGPWTVTGDPAPSAPDVPPPVHSTADASPRPRPIAPIDTGPVEAGILDARIQPHDAAPCGNPDMSTSEATATCCIRHIRAAADGAVDPWLTLAAEPGIADCCNSIRSFCEQPSPAQSCYFYDVVSTVCCPILPGTRVSFCGPWGPPTPPAMPVDRRLA